MKSKEIVFLSYPNRIVVCDKDLIDPVSHDLYEYAHIVKHFQPINYEGQYEFAGDIEWTKNRNMLTYRQKVMIVCFAEKMRESEKDIIADFIKKQGYELEQSVGGSWHLLKNGKCVYDDPACEELNEDKKTAEEFFTEYIMDELRKG